MKGGITIEAALILPVLLMLYCVMLQYFLYMTFLTEAKYICDDAVQDWKRSANMSSEELEQSIQERIGKIGAFSEDQITIVHEDQPVFEKISVGLSAEYQLFYAMPVTVYSKGMRPLSNEFVRLTDWAFHIGGKIRDQVQKGAAS